MHKVCQPTSKTCALNTGYSDDLSRDRSAKAGMICRILKFCLRCLDPNDLLASSHPQWCLQESLLMQNVFFDAVYCNWCGSASTIGTAITLSSKPRHHVRILQIVSLRLLPGVHLHKETCARHLVLRSGRPRCSGTLGCIELRQCRRRVEVAATASCRGPSQHSHGARLTLIFGHNTLAPCAEM